VTRRALIAMTSQHTMPNGRETGVYASELAEAWQVFSEAGYEVDLVSVRGGRPPMEAVNPDDPVQRAFLSDPVMTAKMADTPTAARLDPAGYDIVFVAGGHGAACDLPEDRGLAELIAGAYSAGGVVAAVCHGPAALLNVVLPDGSHLVTGRRVSAFTNAEERAVGMASVVPYFLADELAARGAVTDQAPPFLPHVVVDGRLVTGQNPASARQVAEAAVSVAAAVEAA
jgi:putative intracellular protease/amidase